MKSHEFENAIASTGRKNLWRGSCDLHSRWFMSQSINPWCRPIIHAWKEEMDGSNWSLWPSVSADRMTYSSIQLTFLPSGRTGRKPLNPDPPTALISLNKELRNSSVPKRPVAPPPPARLGLTKFWATGGGGGGGGAGPTRKTNPNEGKLSLNSFYIKA